MKISTMAAMATAAALYATASDAETAGDAVGSIVTENAQIAAGGVAEAADMTGEALDATAWAGCRVARWAAGGREDRTASTGNTLVGLFFRLPVTILGAGTCAVSTVIAAPVKAVGYGFGTLTGGGEQGDARKLGGMRIEDQ